VRIKVEQMHHPRGLKLLRLGELISHLSFPLFNLRRALDKCLAPYLMSVGTLKKLFHIFMIEVGCIKVKINCKQI
jgi:hypothetical protein